MKKPRTVPTVKEALRLVEAALDRYGLLLLSDGVLPSIAGLIAGEPIKGSWWGHPAGNVIFNTCVALEYQGHIISTRLINGKVTFVNATLWPAVVAVGCERASWQTVKLSAPAKSLLTALDKSKSGLIRSDSMPKSIRLGGKKVGDIMKELELRVLVNGTEIHTESGAHAKVVQSWPEFVKALPPKHARRWRPLSAAAGRAELDAAALKLAGRHKFKMPWT